jgi:hypothetical protein
MIQGRDDQLTRLWAVVTIPPNIAAVKSAPLAPATKVTRVVARLDAASGDVVYRPVHARET